MCKRTHVGTYLTVSALQDNAQSFVFPITIVVGHYLQRGVVVFLCVDCHGPTGPRNDVKIKFKFYIK